MAGRSGRALRVAIVVGSAVVANQAAANPPPPDHLADPPVVAPKVAEAPSMVRKHDGGCYVTYPSGGNAKVDCPAELVKEPVGEEIVRDKTTGKCTYVPMVSWSGGSVGPVNCPTMLLDVAKIAGVVSTTTPTIAPIDPPMGGLTPQTSSSGGLKSSKEGSPRRLDDAPPKGGCASSCAIGTTADSASAMAVVGLAVAATVARRRRTRR